MQVLVFRDLGLKTPIQASRCGLQSVEDSEHLPVSEIYKVCGSSSVLFGWAKITLVSGDSCIV